MGKPDLAWLDDLGEQERESLLREVKDQLDRNKLVDYCPYPKQALFHAMGADEKVRERLLIAGNQLGKTLAGSFECAMHLTGRYPEGWEGAVFDYPTAGWAGSETGQGTRDTIQRLLLGDVGSWGTGAIPADAIKEIKRAKGGVPDLVETILVRHISGGTSRVTLKTYDQGRLRWQGETLDFVWFDEEPPEDIYFEGLTRTNATDGIVWVTFTPLKGMSNVVKRFVKDKHAGTGTVTMTIEDALHYTKEQRKAIIASYPAHERDARARGIPVLGSGRIFPLAEEVLKEKAFSLPAYWPRIAGLDFGYDHPTAAVWLAWDRENDTVHLYDAYRVSEATPVVHSAAIKARGTWIPVAWPHDGLQHDKGSGEQLAAQYKTQGVAMLKDRTTFEDGSNGVEAGLMDMLDRMQTGRFKVAEHLGDWWEEFRLYHRKDGKVWKEDDDLMAATRYALMSLRHAKVQPVTQRRAATVPAWTPSVQGMGSLG